MEIQTWLSHHYKFISVKNITILSVSSDVLLRAFHEVAKQQTSWKARNKSSEETESRVIFSAEMNL